MILKLTLVGGLHAAVFILSVVFMESQSHTPGAGAALAIIFVGLGGIAYLLPAYIAALRNAPRFASIFTLNLLVGWTVIGWFASLIWSFVNEKKTAPQIIIQQMYGPPNVSPINQLERQD